MKRPLLVGLLALGAGCGPKKDSVYEGDVVLTVYDDKHPLHSPGAPQGKKHISLKVGITETEFITLVTADNLCTFQSSLSSRGHNGTFKRSYHHQLGQFSCAVDVPSRGVVTASAGNDSGDFWLDSEDLRINAAAYGPNREIISVEFIGTPK